MEPPIAFFESPIRVDKMFARQTFYPKLSILRGESTARQSCFLDPTLEGANKTLSHYEPLIRSLVYN